MNRDYTINKKFPLSNDQNEIIEFLLQRPQACNAAQTRTGKDLYDAQCSYYSNVTK